MLDDKQLSFVKANSPAVVDTERKAAAWSCIYSLVRAMFDVDNPGSSYRKCWANDGYGGPEVRNPFLVEKLALLGRWDRDHADVLYAAVINNVFLELHTSTPEAWRYRWSLVIHSLVAKFFSQALMWYRPNRYGSVEEAVGALKEAFEDMPWERQWLLMSGKARDPDEPDGP